MAIELIDKIKPKNGGGFPMVDAADVQMGDGNRLSAFAEGVASKEYVHDYVQGFVPDVPEGAATEEYVQQYVNDFASGFLDTTLSESGKAADAGAVGEHLVQAMMVISGELANKQPKGNYVQTVNGQTPDEDGNVIVEGGGGGGGDVTKEFVRDYVEARLAAETSTTLLPETTFDDFSPNSAYLGMHTKIITPPPFSLAIGETYRVVWNGEEFTCVGQDASALGISGAVAIGNLAAANIGSGNGEPFGIGANANACILFSLEGRAENTVAIYGDLDRVATENFVKDYVEEANKAAAFIDLSQYENSGRIVETFADGTVKTTIVEFDADRKPVKITDSAGNVTNLTW